MWKVEVTGKETIKPSSPTPPHLRTHKLSWIDRYLPDEVHTAFIILYPNSDPNSLSTLTSSLSQTLSIFYPLAGRLDQSGTYVDCSDQGIDLFKARADTAIIAPISQVPLTQLEELLPCSRYCSKNSRSCNGPVVSVQITEFDKGSIAIGFCISHRIADGHSAAMFIAAWATASREGGNAEGVPRPSFDVATIFALPHEGPSLTPPPRLNSKSPANLVVRRFLFDESAISRIRSQYCFAPNSPKITRVQAMIALFWRCCLRAREKQKLSKASIAGVIVNMRGKGESSPLPDNLFGNAYCFAAAGMPQEDDSEPRRFGEKLSTAIKKIDGELLRRYQGEDGLSIIFDPLIEAAKEACSRDIDIYFFTSWTRFSLYEADFGWGKPAWVGTGGLNTNNVVFLMARGGGDAVGDRGMEAYAVLDEEAMMRLEKDEEITMYAASVLA